MPISIAAERIRTVLNLLMYKKGGIQSKKKAMEVFYQCPPYLVW